MKQVEAMAAADVVGKETELSKTYAAKFDDVSIEIEVRIFWSQASK